jgi:hypothetical protein
LSTGALEWGPARRLRARLTPGVMRAPGKPGAGGLDPKAVEREPEAA